MVKKNIFIFGYLCIIRLGLVGLKEIRGITIENDAIVEHTKIDDFDHCNVLSHERVLVKRSKRLDSEPSDFKSV